MSFFLILLFLTCLALLVVMELRFLVALYDHPFFARYCIKRANCNFTKKNK